MQHSVQHVPACRCSVLGPDPSLRGTSTHWQHRTVCVDCLTRLCTPVTGHCGVRAAAGGVSDASRQGALGM
jgi:hypothetical protein